MPTLRTSFLALALLLVAALSAVAQTPTIIKPGASVRFAWDASPVSADGSNAPDGYKLETFKETATGVTVTTVNVGANTLTADLPPTLMPAGPFFVAVRAVNQAGESVRSNALPFVVAAAPAAPSNFRPAP